jgi:thiamine-phosphate pyrophosphorylase
VATPTQSTQIYLVVNTGDAATARLQAALAAGPRIAAVLITAGAEPLDATNARSLVETAQKADVAALIESNAALARALRADGVHLPWSADLLAAYAEARDVLGTRYMVGVDIAPDAETARHDAMELAEGGADYIGFTTAKAPGDTAQAEFAKWWAEVFQVPCIVFGVTDTDAAQMYRQIGVEFIAIDLRDAVSPADAASRVRGLGAALTAGPAIAGARP